MTRTLKDEWCLKGNDPQDFEELTEEEKDRFKMTIKGSSSQEQGQEMKNIPHATLGAEIKVDPNQVTFSDEEMKVIQKYEAEKRRVVAISKISDREFDEFEQNKEGQFTVSMNENDWQGFQKWKRSKDKAQAGYNHETDRRITAEECQEMIKKAELNPLNVIKEEKPMFFETDDGALINIKNIIRAQRVCAQWFLIVSEKELSYICINENDIERFKRFAKIHGVFGKEM